MGKQEYDESEGNVVPFNKTNKRIYILYITFGLLLLLGIIELINSALVTHVVRYKVVDGSLASSTIYRAIVLRDEKVVGNNVAGYVNYIAREGQRVAVGDLVYLVDEAGSLNEYMEAQANGENTLTDKELNDFRTDIINFVHQYDNTNYDSVYDFKYTLKNTVSKLANTKLLNNMDGNPGYSMSFKYAYSGNSGIVSYWYDDYEQLKANEVSKACFDEKNYEKHMLLSNELRGIDETIYKLSLKDEWSIVFPIEESVGEELLKEDYILVKFLKNQNESWGKVSLLHNADGTYLELTFTNSMVSYCDDRYLDVELMLRNEAGLKIPKSAIAEKEFFLIDDTYVTESEEGEEYTVLMQVYNDDGSKTASSTKLEVYYHDVELGVYYVDDSVVAAGDLLFGSDQSTFVIKERGTLIGVYNINKGYADFKQITILYENEDYAIVKSNTSYGIRVHDFIALDADTVDDNQFISKTN